MASSSKSAGSPHQILIALAILNLAGFLILYVKLDLDSSLAAGDVGVLSQQIQGLENRLNAQKAVETTVPVQPIGGMMPINGATNTVPRMPGMPQNY